MGDNVARARALDVESRKRIVRTRHTGVVLAFALLMTCFSGGVAAAADPLVGKKYSDAASWISRRNGTPVVATVSGSQLALDDCIVISWSRGGFLNSRGRNDRRNEYYVNLNCNNRVASPGHPGNSVMTPEGAKEKALRDQAATINARPERCERDEATMKWCVRICTTTGLCEVGV